MERGLVRDADALAGLDGLVTTPRPALSCGSELEALARPMSIENGASEIFRIPTYVVGVSLDAITQ